GLIEKQGYNYYVLARAGSPIEEGCLYCHGDPAAAPKEIIKRYGTASGFNMRVGDVLDTLIAYIPVQIPLISARKIVAIFIGIYTIFFGIVFYLVNRRFGWFYEKISSDKETIENISKEILNLNREMEDIVAERIMGMVGLRIADRIRNPVTVIGGLCRQVYKKEMDDASKEKLGDILTECERMEKIVADFDELVKSKRFLFKREDLNEIAYSTIRLVENEIKDKDIGLIIDLYEKPLMFNANRQLIKIAVRHILGNAIDATPIGGKITISSSVKGESIFLTITDTGKGMTSEELHRIFEPFYSTKGRTGMGLPLVRQIIAEHMGEIIIDSKPNIGSTVRFAFPTRWRETAVEDVSE
ncbi:MAG: ATP-binding protein, partial [Nitrospirae bacterium]|nr:ATP-binding protein [Nitrospirota bacterium]